MRTLPIPIGIHHTHRTDREEQHIAADDDGRLQHGELLVRHLPPFHVPNPFEEGLRKGAGTCGVDDIVVPDLHCVQRGGLGRGQRDEILRNLFGDEAQERVVASCAEGPIFQAEYVRGRIGVEGPVVLDGGAVVLDADDGADGRHVGFFVVVGSGCPLRNRNEAGDVNVRVDLPIASISQGIPRCHPFPTNSSARGKMTYTALGDEYEIAQKVRPENPVRQAQKDLFQEPILLPATIKMLPHKRLGALVRQQLISVSRIHLQPGQHSASLFVRQGQRGCTPGLPYFAGDAGVGRGDGQAGEQGATVEEDRIEDERRAGEDDADDDDAREVQHRVPGMQLLRRMEARMSGVDQSYWHKA